MKDLIDINQTLDLVKLKLYNEWLYTAHIYDEGDSNMHQGLTTKVVEKYIDPLNLPKDAVILDVGCGPGYFLDEMKKREFYESPSEKRRRLKKEKELNLFKQKMKESFIASNNLDKKTKGK